MRDAVVVFKHCALLQVGLVTAMTGGRSCLCKGGAFKLNKRKGSRERRQAKVKNSLIGLKTPPHFGERTLGSHGASLIGCAGLMVLG